MIFICNTVMGGNWHFRLTHNKAGVVSDIHHNNLKRSDGSAVTTDDDFKQWLNLEEFSNGYWGYVSWSTPIGLSCQQQGINADFKFPFIVNSLPRGLCGDFNQVSRVFSNLTDHINLCFLNSLLTHYDRQIRRF